MVVEDTEMIDSKMNGQPVSIPSCSSHLSIFILIIDGPLSIKQPVLLLPYAVPYLKVSPVSFMKTRHLKFIVKSTSD